MADIGDFETGWNIQEANTTGHLAPLTLRLMVMDWVRFRNPGTDAYTAGLVDRLFERLNKQNGG